MCRLFTDEDLRAAYGVTTAMELCKIKINISTGIRILDDLKNTDKIPEHQRDIMEDAAERYILNKPVTKLQNSLRETIYFDPPTAPVNGVKDED